MRRRFLTSPFVVWPVFMLVAAVAFVWSYIAEQKSALQCAWYDSFSGAIRDAKHITAKEPTE